jgi:hypothetical protein
MGALKFRDGYTLRCITFQRDGGPPALSRFQAEIMVKRLAIALNTKILGMQVTTIMPKDARTYRWMQQRATVVALFRPYDR